MFRGMNIGCLLLSAYKLPMKLFFGGGRGTVGKDENNSFFDAQYNKVKFLEAL